MTLSDQSKKAGRISNVVCPNCKASLDDVIESLIRQRGKFKGQRERERQLNNALRTDLFSIAAERDRFRETLECIAQAGSDPAFGSCFCAAEEIAKAALDEQGEEGQ